MTVATRKPALALVLAHEGGFSNHPADPGGATNRGITQRVYDAYRKSRGLAVRSVRYISDDEVADIYNKNYWQLIKGDRLPAGLDYAVFDFAVNSGVSRAVKFLQKGLGFVGDDVDGIIGLRTEARIDAAMRKNEELVISNYCADRLTFVRGLSTFNVFGKGWTRRIIGDKAGAQPGKDSGVLDFAIGFARHDTAYQMPSAIGSKPGEVAGKATEPVSYADAVSAGWGLK